MNEEHPGQARNKNKCKIMHSFIGFGADTSVPFISSIVACVLARYALGCLYAGGLGAVATAWSAIERAG